MKYQGLNERKFWNFQVDQPLENVIYFDFPLWYKSEQVTNACKGCVSSMCKWMVYFRRSTKKTKTLQH